MLSHIVVKPNGIGIYNSFGLRVVLSHIVVKRKQNNDVERYSLRVVLSHIVVKPHLLLIIIK